MSLIPRMTKQQGIIRMAQLIAATTKGNVRSITSSASRAGVIDSKSAVAPCYKRIKALQEKFQIEDGVPVHLKGGTMDRILYYSSMLLIAVGLAQCLEFFYTQSFPKKDK